MEFILRPQSVLEYDVAVRVQAPCMATGQAAGCAAALAAQQNIPEVPFSLLRHSLESLGAIVPTP